MTRKSVGSFRLDRTAAYTIRKRPEIILPEKETEPRLRIQMSRCPAQIPSLRDNGIKEKTFNFPSPPQPSCCRQTSAVNGREYK